MSLALLLVFVVPFTLAILRIVDHADPIVGWAKGWRRTPCPAAGLGGASFLSGALLLEIIKLMDSKKVLFIPISSFPRKRESS